MNIKFTIHTAGGANKTIAFDSISSTDAISISSINIVREQCSASELAERFKRDYSLKYFKLISKDRHKYEANFKIKDNIKGFSYIEAYSEDLGEVIGFCSCDVYPAKYNGKQITASGTHCLCSLPNGRKMHLARKMVEILYHFASIEHSIYVDFEICNEISNKAYIHHGWKETGKFKVTKDGHRCMIRSEKIFE